MLLPKSPFEEIFTNLPFSSTPNNLKFLSFFDKGVSICFKSISILLLIFFKILTFDFLFKNLFKFLASYFLPLRFIVFPKSRLKSLLRVFTLIFSRETKSFFLIFKFRTLIAFIFRIIYFIKTD